MVTAILINLITTLTITNGSGEVVRIQELQSKCGGPLIQSPIYLKRGESRSFKTDDVVHAYMICGGGFCSMSAIGIEKGTKQVTATVTFDSDGFINVSQSPDVWKTGNFTCPGGANGN